MMKMPQVLLNVAVKSKPPLDSLPGVAKAVEEVEKHLRDRGRVVLRYSGTEPLARVMVEGPDLDTVTKMAEKIAGALTEALN
jgi:phosphoglucosamine mutase